MVSGTTALLLLRSAKREFGSELFDEEKFQSFLYEIKEMFSKNYWVLMEAVEQRMKNLELRVSQSEERLQDTIAKVRC